MLDRRAVCSPPPRDFRHVAGGGLQTALRSSMQGHPRESAVLVVEADPTERERLGSLLEQAGLAALLCPGATGPTTRASVPAKACARSVRAVDVVVLDMSLDSEAMMMGTAAEELLDLYRSSSRPVVVLGSYLVDEEPRQLARLHRHPQRDELVDAVKSMLVPGDEGAPHGQNVAGLVSAPGLTQCRTPSPRFRAGGLRDEAPRNAHPAALGVARRPRADRASRVGRHRRGDAPREHMAAGVTAPETVEAGAQEGRTSRGIGLDPGRTAQPHRDVRPS